MPAKRKLVGPNVDRPSVLGFFRTTIIANSVLPMASATLAVPLAVTQVATVIPVAPTPQSQVSKRIKVPTLYFAETAAQFPWSRRIVIAPEDFTARVKVDCE